MYPLIFVILLVINLGLFIAALDLDKIERKNRLLSNILDKSYKFGISFVLIIYSVIFLIHVLSLDVGLYAFMDVRIANIIFCSIIIIINILKILIYFLILKNNNVVAFIKTLCIIIGAGLTISYFIGMFFLPSLNNNDEYVLDGNKNLIEQVSYEQMVIDEDSSSKEEYNLVIIGENGKEYSIDFENDDVNVQLGNEKILEKYEVKKIFENMFEIKKEKISYEYLVITDDVYQKNLISFYSKMKNGN